MTMLRVVPHDKIYRDLIVENPAVPGSGDTMEYSDAIAALNPTPQQMATIRKLGRGKFHIALLNDGAAVLVIEED